MPISTIGQNGLQQSRILTAVQQPAGAVLQVVQTVKTDTFSTTSASYVDVTGLSVSITPTSASSKIFVSYSIQFSGITDSYGAATVLRNSTIISQGTSATGNQTNVTTALATGSSGNWDYKLQTSQFEFLDSPATTSATTYKIQVKATYSNRTVLINGPYSTDNAAYNNFGVSTITVMEIAA